MHIKGEVPQLSTNKIFLKGMYADKISMAIKKIQNDSHCKNQTYRMDFTYRQYCAYIRNCLYRMVLVGCKLFVKPKFPNIIGYCPYTPNCNHGRNYPLMVEISGCMSQNPLLNRNSTL